MDYERISRYISLILRHKPKEINITLDKHGYVKVSDLVKGIKRKYKGFTESDLDVIVKTDDKQRYKYSTDGKRIRAVQGHSIPVDLELTEQQPPKLLYHGTSNRYVDSISKQGLIPKQRQYVHLSNNTFTAYKVGQRHGGKTIIYVIDALQMYNKGYKFYCAENGVWMIDSIPPQYLVNCYHVNTSEELSQL